MYLTIGGKDLSHKKIQYSKKMFTTRAEPTRMISGVLL